jgi:hypothetical protein
MRPDQELQLCLQQYTTQHARSIRPGPGAGQLGAKVMDYITCLLM